MPTKIGTTRELLNLAAPVILVTEAEQVVKGFASVETLDRSEDLVAPEEFNIEQFMAAPTMLVNHRFWIDPFGNEIGVGVPKELFVAKLKDIGSDTDWGIVNVKTGEQTHTFPKQKVPALKAGDRGLFIVAEITEDDVWREVELGKLQAFSWRGLVRVEYKAVEDGVQRVLTNIDLYEISLVNVPDHPSATFVVAKSAEGEPLTVSHVQLHKTHFASQGLAVEYLKSRGLRHDLVRDSGDTWTSLQNVGKFKAETFVRAKMNQGVFFVAGTLEDQPMSPPPSWLEQLLVTDVQKLAVDAAAPTKEENAMSDTSKDDVKKDAAPTDEAAKTPTDETKKDEAKSQPEAGKTDAAKTDAQKPEETLNLIASKTAEAVVAGLKPAFEGLTDTLKGLTEVTQKSAEVLTALGQPADASKSAETDGKKDGDSDTGKTEAAKSVDLTEVNDTLNTLAKGLLAVSQQVEQVQKTAKGIAKSTPTTEDREEKTETAKSAADSDPNSVFDGSGLWPFRLKS